MTIGPRASGILLHLSSLPSPFGSGDLGPGAYQFADRLAAAKQRCWQVLPLNPVDWAYGFSPYSSCSAFAGNPLLISPQAMVEDGLLQPSDLADAPAFPADHCEFNRVVEYRERLFAKAFQRYLVSAHCREVCAGFSQLNSYWLEDFALFRVIKRRLKGRVWSEWPAPLRDRDQGELDGLRREAAEELEKERFLQCVFNLQWHRLREYCNGRGVRLIGDIPIYVSYDSADVWENSRVFKLDANKRPTAVAGVPPDYFSKTGQLWGNPLFDWERERQDGFRWWLSRLEHNFSLFDLVRLDHFRGFVACWEVPAGEKTAVNGHWAPAPAGEFFAAVKEQFPRVPLIAEDLGMIDDPVRQVMARFGIPGMKILLFAFGEDLKTHPYLPHNFPENCVVYTGTHDNNTVRGWYEHEASVKEKEQLARYLGGRVDPQNVHWQLIELALGSPARLAIFPLQDILGLDEKARMNFPSETHGNWTWRLLPGQFDEQSMARLAAAAERSGRA